MLSEIAVCKISVISEYALNIFAVVLTLLFQLHLFVTTLGHHFVDFNAIKASRKLSTYIRSSMILLI